MGFEPVKRSERAECTPGGSGDVYMTYNDPKLT